MVVRRMIVETERALCETDAFTDLRTNLGGTGPYDGPLPSSDFP